MKKIYLLRHGHADFSNGDYDQLTLVGQQQAQVVGQYWKKIGLNFDHVYTGLLKRQIQTFDLLNKSLQLDLAKLKRDSRLNEFDFEGLMAQYCRLNSREPSVIEHQAEPKNKKKYFRCLKEAFSAWAENKLPTHEESYLNFRKRVTNVVDDLRKIQGDNILVVSSGGVLSHMIADALRLDEKMALDLNLQINNTSISSLILGESTTKLSLFNSLAHIEDSQLTHLVSY